MDNVSKDPRGTQALARMAHYRLTLSRVDNIASAALRADPGGPSANEMHRLVDEVRAAVAHSDPPLPATGRPHRLTGAEGQKVTIDLTSDQARILDEHGQVDLAAGEHYKESPSLPAGIRLTVRQD